MVSTPVPRLGPSRVIVVKVPRSAGMRAFWLADDDARTVSLSSWTASIRWTFARLALFSAACCCACACSFFASAAAAFCWAWTLAAAALPAAALASLVGALAMAAWITLAAATSAT
jgi:hypothetical protein